MSENGPVCGIYLVVEAAAGAVERLSAALGAAPVQSLLVAPVGAAEWTEFRPDTGLIRRIVETAQSANVAGLVAADAELAAAVGADGVHVPWSANVEQAYAAARRTVGRQLIVGVSAGRSRHDAMVLAEAGADYIGFAGRAADATGPEAVAGQCALVAWWAEIFESPCVAFDVETPEQTRLLTAAGADFIATRLAAGLAPADAAERVAVLARAIAARE